MKKRKLLQKVINKLVEAGFKDGKIVENQVIRSIKALKALPKYKAIQALSEYLKGLKRRQRQHTLYIETVIPLPSDQLKKIKRIVEKKTMPTGEQVKITKSIVNINSQILGGFKLKVGDEIWDESILAKLNQIKEVIVHGRHN